MSYTCEICGKEYANKDSYKVHCRRKHPESFKRTDVNVVCPLCSKNFDAPVKLLNHLVNEHKLAKTSLEYLIAKEKALHTTFKKNGIVVPEEIALDMINALYKYNECKNVYQGQVVSYYRMITAVREYILGKDTENFIKSVLPWKLAHAKQGNCKELCLKVFPDSLEQSEELYQKYMLDKNPFVGHDGTLSPFSKDFIGYEGLNESEKELKVREATGADRPDRTSTQIEYWIKKGLTKQQAYKMVHSAAHAFSLEKCVKKYGFEEGYRRWKERQLRWQATLKAKPYEEQLRILKAKVANSKIVKPYSRIEHEFSSQIVNDEFMNVAVTPYAVPDICVDHKIIEFYGDYYHANPKIYAPDYFNHDVNKTAKEIWEKDEIRIHRLIDDGYEIKIVWESDYIANKQGIIEECKKFLEEL